MNLRNDPRKLRGKRMGGLSRRRFVFGRGIPLSVVNLVPDSPTSSIRQPLGDRGARARGDIVRGAGSLRPGIVALRGIEGIIRTQTPGVFDLLENIVGMSLFSGPKNHSAPRSRFLAAFCRVPVTRGPSKAKRLPVPAAAALISFFSSAPRCIIDFSIGVTKEQFFVFE